MRARRLLLLPLTLAFCIQGCGGCDPEMPTDTGENAPQEVPPLPSPDLRLAIITDLQGTLAPCGCTSRPLGGLDHMVGALGDLDPAPAVFVGAGEMFFGGAAHAGPEGGDPEDWKRATLAQTLVAQGLRAVGGAEDEECCDGATPLFHNGAVIEAGEHTIGLLPVWSEAEALAHTAEETDCAERDACPLIFHASAESTVTAGATRLREEGAEVVIALSVGDRRVHRRLAAVEGVDFVVAGGLDREEPLPPAGDEAGWVVHAGRQGQRLLVLDLYLGEDTGGAFADISRWTWSEAHQREEEELDELRARIATWREEGQSADAIARQEQRLAQREAAMEADAAPTYEAGSRAFAAAIIELAPDAPASDAVTETMAHLDRRINDHNEQAFADRLPPPVDEGEAAYLGSAACGSCHASAYSWWQGHPHGRAYATLEERHKEFHLDCVGCHVTGYERPGGSTVTHNLEGALTNVGCENCHGPGSLHVTAPASHEMRLNPPESVCVQCHNEEHSDRFQYDAYRRSLLVPGHGR